MRVFGGLGGIKGGRPRNRDDEFESAVDRAMGDRLRAEWAASGGKTSDLGCRLWGSLANCDWKHENGDKAGYSFRAAGDLIAAVIGDGDYMNWYCSGLDGHVDGEVGELMAKQGWTEDA